MSAKPSVCVVDDNESLRAALKVLFRSKNIPFQAYANSAEFFETFGEKPIGCLILDLNMPGGTGLEILEELRRKDIHLPTIVLTGHADVPTAVKLLKAGAMDVLEKPFQDAVLIERVQQAFAKLDHYRKFQSERQAAEPKIASLTPREVEVLDHMVSGKKNRKIAEELGISTKTLDIHRANIMRKMQTKTVADLVRWRLVNKAEPSGVMPVIVKA